MEEAVSLTINPSEIEHQLRVYQHDISPDEARTSLFNLVVYTPASDTGPLMEAVNQLMGKRPCRVIVVKTGAPGESSVHVSARCVEDAERQQICIQEIVITSGADGAGQLPASWTPLCIPGLPTYLWWRQALPAEAKDLLRTFEDHVDRILVDASLGGSPLEFFRSYSRCQDPLPLTDFAWARLHPLMKLTAGLFNPLEVRPFLHRLTRVSLTGGSREEGWLFLLWFSSRMDWNISLENTTQGSWKGKNAQGLAVNFFHSSGKALSGGFLVEMEDDEGRVYKITSREGDLAECLPGNMPSYTAVYRIPTSGDILIREVDHYGTDRIFTEALGKL